LHYHVSCSYRCRLDHLYRCISIILHPISFQFSS
jgi:hypothetical protein